MKIRSIELVNFKKFNGRARVTGIGDGVSLLAGRNEAGKSTMLEAINAAFFQSFKSGSKDVRLLRHYLNGAAPEVTVEFEAQGETWSIHKRFDEKKGKARLEGGGKRPVENEAAEDKLQRLLGFSVAGRKIEPGIWGALWVRQGHPFGEDEFDDDARRSVEACLAAQVGVVTGGAGALKIQREVSGALKLLVSSNGPRGKFKDAKDGLRRAAEEAAQLQRKRDALEAHLHDFATHSRDLRRLTADWDEDAHRRDLASARAKLAEAAEHAAKIDAARQDAAHAVEKAEAARKLTAERAKLREALAALQASAGALRDKAALADAARIAADETAAGEQKRLKDLREAAAQSAGLIRAAERQRGAAALARTIQAIEAALAGAAALEEESAHLAAAIAANPATDAALRRIEEAVSRNAAAQAALNAAAVRLAFGLNEKALAKIRVNGERLGAASAQLAVTAPTRIEIEGIGFIAVEPQIKDGVSLQAAAAAGEAALAEALSAAGADTEGEARRRAAKRRELERQSEGVRRDIVALAPGDPASRLKPGLEPLKIRFMELQAKLAAELTALDLKTAPEEDLTEALSEAQAKAGGLAAEIAQADAAWEAKSKAAQAGAAAAQRLNVQFAAEERALQDKEADLAASPFNDEQLAGRTAAALKDAGDKQAHLAALTQKPGEAAEVIEARIKRLTSAMDNHRAAAGALRNKIAELGGLISGMEGDGLDEALDQARAGEARLAAAVAAFEEDAAVLQLLHDTLYEAEAEAKTLYLAPVASRVAPYLNMLIPGSGITLNEKLKIGAIERDGRREDFQRLSGGTQEQLAILTRIAFADLLIGQGRPAAVILDDALAFSDDARMETMFDILMHAGERMQIIVLTCRARLFSRLGGQTIHIEHMPLAP